MKTKIYVASNIQYEAMDLPDMYQYIDLWDNKIEFPNIIKDTEGENIHELNPLLNDATCTYYMWKNDKDSELLGLNHYRRFFELTTKEGILQQEDVDEIFKDYNLLTAPYCLLDQNDEALTVRKHIENCTNNFELQWTLRELKNNILNISPDYYDSYVRVMNSRGFYPCNLYIMTRELFENYCSWLFSVILPIANIRKELNCPNDRILGYVCERLLSVWIDKNSDIIHQFSNVNVKMI